MSTGTSLPGRTYTRHRTPYVLQLARCEAAEIAVRLALRSPSPGTLADATLRVARLRDALPRQPRP